MNNRNISSRRSGRRASAGFALVEALVALLVVAFGMMAIAAFQFTLSRSSDVAKQRTEATRIAQREIDRLRSFVARGADGTPGDASLTYVEDLAVSALPASFTTVPGLTTNTDFEMQRTISAPPAPVPLGGEKFRWINVVVRWSDRTGAEQRVTLSSAISDGAPGDLGGLSTGRGVATTLKPKNRNINIPYPAVNLAGGLTSAFAVPPNNVVFIFDNETGRVIGRCTVSQPAEGDTLTPTSTGCSTADAYLLSGYVRFKTQGAAANRANIDDPTNDLTDPTRPLQPTVLNPVSPAVATQPLTITSSATGYGPSDVECYAQEQATLRNSSGFEITVPTNPPPSSLPSGYSFAGNQPRFIAYTCIVSPIDHDSDVATAKIWSGEVTLNPLPSGTGNWRFGTSNGDFKLCRFTSDYNRNGILSNGEHPRYYRRVSGTLDSQNYLVVNRNDDCPADLAADPAGGNYQNTHTVVHQPSGAAELSYSCSVLANASTNTCNNANKTVPEPALGTVPIAALPME